MNERVAEMPLCDPMSVWEVMHLRVGGLTQEKFWVIGLDARCRAMDVCLVHIGGRTSIAVDAPSVFRPLIQMGAVSAIVVHNHPSGDPAPSTQDKLMTARLMAGGELLDLPIADHVIVTEEGFYSFAEQGDI